MAGMLGAGPEWKGNPHSLLFHGFFLKCWFGNPPSTPPIPLPLHHQLSLCCRSAKSTGPSPSICRHIWTWSAQHPDPLPIFGAAGISIEFFRPASHKILRG